ncbi:hypothetical protein SAMN05421813_10323 [Daejeonella rubra]|uniref:Outer membrane protein beta-barrel family protein n=1 Tax=Daejeonella rubra TaxID=990371 RepID=A0A1G9NFZ4_9SPHI|nr:hypothetical protein SAMN05421813_10323 [Daejeonella rubra]
MCKLVARTYSVIQVNFYIFSVNDYLLKLNNLFPSVNMLYSFEREWKFKAGFTRSFSQGSLFSTLYYQDIKNPIQRVNSVYAES